MKAKVGSESEVRKTRYQLNKSLTMPLFSKKKMLGGEKIVPMPRQRSDSLFQKLQRRQKIVEQREGAEIEPIMEVRLRFFKN